MVVGSCQWSSHLHQSQCWYTGSTLQTNCFPYLHTHRNNTSQGWVALFIHTQTKKTVISHELFYLIADPQESYHFLTYIPTYTSVQNCFLTHTHTDTSVMVSSLIYTGGIDFFLIHKPKLFTQREINISQRLFPLFPHPQALRSVMDCPLQEVYMQKQNLLTCNANTIARAVPRTSAADDIWLPVGPFCCEPQSDLG